MKHVKAQERNGYRPEIEQSEQQEKNQAIYSPQYFKGMNPAEMVIKGPHPAFPLDYFGIKGLGENRLELYGIKNMPYGNNHHENSDQFPNIYSHNSESFFFFYPLE
jgi:hypothetical protein